MIELLLRMSLRFLCGDLRVHPYEIDELLNIDLDEINNTIFELLKHPYIKTQDSGCDNITALIDNSNSIYGTVLYTLKIATANNPILNTPEINLLLHSLEEVC